jgi:ribonucleoside-diphosphate reductase alpha chain
MLRDRTYVKLKDLKPGDSVFPSISFDSSGSFANFKNQVATNHKVVSVEFCGHEDVFNITVDDNHNYHVITSQGDDKAVISSGVCVKNCGEIWLSPYDCCDLGSLVLPRFVLDDRKDLDWDLLRKTVAVAVRFLDNVLTVNNYPLVEIKDQCSNIRRVGLGITGLHDMLLRLGLRYNSSAGLEFVDKVMDRIKNWAYEASSDIAAEKGSFPKFDPDQFLRGGFAKTLKPSIREKIRENGMRNCAVLTVAPVGTGSMVCDTSSGIEPMFAPAYRRKYRDGDKLREEVVIHPLFKRFMDEGRPVKHFQGAHDLKLRDHFEMQRTVQRHIDNAVSKTLNIPRGVKEHELSDLYMEYFPELKGVTVYPEGSREDQPLTPMDLDEAIKAYQRGIVETAAVEDKCKSGVCEL